MGLNSIVLITAPLRAQHGEDIKHRLGGAFIPIFDGIYNSGHFDFILPKPVLLCA